MTINEVRDICLKISHKYGYHLNCPINENGRLSRTLGRCCFKGGDELYLEKIEFSKIFLATATDKTVIDVILHELAHAFAFFEWGWEKESHGPLFRKMCARIGAVLDAPSPAKAGQTLEYKDANGRSAHYKYSIYCSCCGKLIGTKSRACVTTKEPNRFKSSCCEATIKVIQNW